MQDILYKVSMLTVIDAEVIKTGASFLALKVWDNCLHIAFFILIVVGDIAEILLIFFRTWRTLFLLFLRAVASVFISLGSKSWDF